MIRHCDDRITPRLLHALPIGHSWSRVPRVTPLCDAAHLMSPFAGEGVTAAMLDAAVLAGLLLEHEDDVETALTSYEHDMFPRAAEAARQSAFARMRFAALRSSTLKTARAWALKESLRGLWKHRSRAAGERWYGWAMRSRLAPVKKVAATVRRHLPNVLTYFKHCITNGGSEAINRVVQMLKKRAFGYRSFKNFRMVILFRCGGLNLYPATHLKPG